MLSAVQPPAASRVERAHVRLRDGIIRGEFPSGSRLNAASIAAELNLSVIPVREAIRLLEAEGLVVIERNRGARVHAMTASDLEDIYLTRLALETDALRRSLPNLTDDDIDRADEALDQMTIAYTKRTIAEAITWHRQFHDLLYSRSRSQRLPQLIDSLWSASDRYLWTSPQLFRDDNYREEHEPLLLAARERDVAAAVEALNLHHQMALARIRDTAEWAAQDNH